MGKHRKPSLIQKRAATVVPTIVLAAVLMSGSSWHTGSTAADISQPSLASITTSAPSRITSQWEMHKPASERIVPKAEPRVHVVHTSAPRPKPSSVSVIVSSSVVGTVVHAAETQLGVPYVYGGETPGSAFDCSGLVQYAYGVAGKWVPRVANDQFNFFKMIPRAEAVPGDLVFFHDNSDPSSYVYHVGIYDGGDTMIVAPTEGQDVQYQNFSWGGDTVTFGTL
jgi:cell wall-associated NlpC family hydrolase